MSFETKRVVYQTEDGGVAVIIPCECGLTIEEIAAKDVPSGKPHAIIEASDIPTDRVYREAWSVDVSDLIDGVGA